MGYVLNNVLLHENVQVEALNSCCLGDCGYVHKQQTGSRCLSVDSWNPLWTLHLHLQNLRKRMFQCQRSHLAHFELEQTWSLP
ncbi:unnamed protein product [Hymenolepis diminuta]|uniref:Apple domain-containing protein n=1 Tax=Hymenolepis diminuta TaxID=6216 RepID=A0A0R3SJH7_HYMDI|nr:unnamed protein product [Hymenolepis diminuta]